MGHHPDWRVGENYGGEERDSIDNISTLRLCREGSEKAATVPIHPFPGMKFGHIDQSVLNIYLSWKCKSSQTSFIKAKLLDFNVAIHLQCTLTAFIFLFKTKN